MSQKPIGWENAELGAVLSIRNGYAFKTVDFKNEGIPLVKQSNLAGETVDLTKCAFLPNSFLTEYERFQLRKGDILVGMSGSIGKLCLFDKDVTALQNQRTGKVELHSKIDVSERYVWHFLKTIEKQLVEKGKGVAVANVSAADIEGLPFPLAPLPEQKRIADKLDATLARVDACRARLERVQPILKRFRLSVLAAATSGHLTADWREQQGYGHAGNDNKGLHGNTNASQLNQASPINANPSANAASKSREAASSDPRTESHQCSIGQSASSASILKTPLVIFQADQEPLVEGWYWEKLVTLAKLESGHTPRKSVPEYWENGTVPWISLQDIRAADGREITDTKYMPTQLGIDNSSSRLLPKGTVCFCRDISFGYVTMMGREMATTQHFANWVCHDALVPKYLMYAFMAGRDFLGMSSGQGTTVTTIYMPALKELRLATPPVAEQTEIVRRVETLFAFADRLEARLASATAAAERLTPSLLAKAFRGELVPQYPTDEPASELLNRLATQREAAGSKPKRSKKASA
ncbi:restriction endonuclease subunit S [Chitinibacter sp. GC72]|uniref:restriction endonuclease subunit S n=1 Tax=Chitinibacter sp. GC72 TaxID=1526917 RepID=UPI0012F9D71E|nr:restriction endonuclease subunit S [Chitinibacter sp. GC72]